MNTLISIALITYAFLPLISSIAIDKIQFIPLQKLFFLLGYSTLLMHPYHKIKVRVNNCNFEGYASSSSLIKCLYLNGSYERSVVRFMYRYLSKSNILIDIGANEGFFTTLMGKVCKKVIAIEPSKANINMMKRNLEINSVKNVTIHQVAAGNENGTIVFNECLINGMWNNVGKKRYPVGMTSYNVPVKRVYDIINPKDIPHIKIIKIDAENFEFPVIQGLEELLSNDDIIWIVETRSKRVVKYFVRRGFLSYYLPDDSVSFPQVLYDVSPLENITDMVNCIFTKTQFF